MWQNLLFSRLQGLVLDQDDLKHCLNPPKFKFIFKKSLRPLVCDERNGGRPFVRPFKSAVKRADQRAAADKRADQRAARHYVDTYQRP